MPIFWVRQSGGGGGGTSYADAWNGAAVWGGAGVNAGDTLMICGSWTGQQQLFTVSGSGTQGNEIIIDGSYAGDPAVIQTVTGTNSIGIGDKSWITFQDIEFSNGGVVAAGSNPFWIGNAACDGISFIRCTFADCHHAIAVTPNGAQTPTKKLWVEDCTFHDITGRGIWVYARADAAILDNITIKDSEFYNCGGRGIDITSGGIYGGVQYLSYADNVLIQNCTFHDNTNFSSLGIICTEQLTTTLEDYRPRRVVIEDCTFTDEEAAGFQIDMTYWDGTPEGRSIVRRCTTNNCSLNATAGSMENIGCDGLIVEDCTFSNGHTIASYDGVGLWMDLLFGVEYSEVPRNCIYRRNKIINHTGYAPTTFWDSATSPGKGAGTSMPSAGIRILAGVDNTVYENIVINAGCGLVIGTRPVWAAANTRKFATGNRVFNNTFINCTHAGVWYDDVNDTSNLVYNNVFWNDSTVTQPINYPAFATSGSVQQTLEDNLFNGFVNSTAITISGINYTTTGAPILANGLTVNPELYDAMYQALGIGPA